MDPWYKVVTPRREVREGRSFSPDEFAIASGAGCSQEPRRWTTAIQLSSSLAPASPAR